MKALGYIAVVVALIAWGTVRAEENAAPAGGKQMGGCGMMGGGCGMGKMGGHGMKDGEMKGGCGCGGCGMMIDADTNKDGKISDEERAAVKAKIEERRKEMFKKYDKDGDGKLSEEEFAAMKKDMPACHAEPKAEQPK